MTRLSAFQVRRVAIVVAVAACAVALACGDDAVSPPAQPQLNAAKSATERYQSLANALADGYVDAHIVMQGMGHHFLNSALVDGHFDPDHPEILVYMPEADSMRLVALEYAVPLDSSAAAPAGFTGTQDVWDHNTTYSLWTLHAWVWYDNPSGIFSPTNPRVHLTDVPNAHVGMD